ncbi:DNA topoisomerase (ATP-hydrolyzing) [Microbacterium sorbitolivorans]|uniref:DNA topoisomerase (ATP-hydrolyzing) n=1 Tax=Microbacterium sorbitolivorans TaxID=1867410 RepID=A0A367Y824_9MICO|nr:DNA topoisomerase IV subunit A [Microbacterium sorbitolivorans]RCK61779.1 DNA topoisomerase IV subunit A [Microbacterium sorbitolivorans]GGF29218.1 DNA topoisomerase (ATP-hydrolyzing) [Microbacterium sorbitolivorans]
MARQKDPTPPVEERIEEIALENEMQGSYLEYAYSVIYSRALPDARDGLKPVQRRILFQMAEMGLRPERGHVKSARVVGDVMGKLHPHGDTAIYDALVRLAQDFAMRVPLVDGHGNFGSLDDGPAASRYTEARLDRAAMRMTEDLGEDVVDFVPNYDGQYQQPAVLPAAYPNLLVNGATGIAVGMATNMAPHNLIEVVNAATHLLENPDATTAELMQFVPGPDFPSGGIIMGLDGVRDAYETGRGSVKVRAKAAIEQIGPRRTGIVVTELPYMVGPERVIEKLKDAVQAKKLQGISDVNDLSDRKNGLRLVIGVKTGFDAAAVLERLYRLTPLEDSFGFNNVALVDGQPSTLGLRDMLVVYVNHRIEVVTRRTRYRLARRQERLHLVEGLLIAILDIDEVIQVIRSSETSEEARTRLCQVFDLDEIQAEYILELRLRRLTKFSRIELENERDELKAEIAKLEELLGSDALIRGQVALELETVADELGTPRRTVLMNAKPAQKRTAKQAESDLQIADAPTLVALSTTGRAIRIDTPDGEEIVAPARRGKHDAIRSTARTTVRGELGAVTNRGRLVRFSPVDLPSVPLASISLSAGARLRDYIGLTDRTEQVVGLVELASDTPLALGTAQGVVKRLVPSALPAKPEIEIVALKPKDSVVGIAPATDESDLVFLTDDAKLLRFTASSVRPQGASAGGMAGIKLAAGAAAIFFGSVTGDGNVVVTISTSSSALPGTDPGRAKISDFGEYPSKGRATGGVRAHAFLKGEDRIQLGWAGPDPAYALDSKGSVRKLPMTLSKRDGSGQLLEAEIDSIGRAL